MREKQKKREGKGLAADKSLQIHTNEQEKRESETYANEDEDLYELRGEKDKLIVQVFSERCIA